ncbi:MAG: hypothetical protein ACO1OB_24860 [Archangium sp.]
MNRADRRELAVLGLMALAWCLVFAPFIHRFTHAHGHEHAHSGPLHQGPHGAGTFEHQSVSFTASVEAPVITLQLYALLTPDAVQPSVPELRALRRVEQSQAP